jgi:hypothetical protein
MERGVEEAVPGAEELARLLPAGDKVLIRFGGDRKEVDEGDRHP